MNNLSLYMIFFTNGDILNALKINIKVNSIKTPYKCSVYFMNYILSVLKLIYK